PLRLEGRERDRGERLALRARDERLDTALRHLLELRLRRRLVDEAPLDRALAAHALGDRREGVGEVTADLALVDEPREAAGAGEDREERRLGEAHRARAVVREDDLVAGDRELVSAARRRAVQRREAR